jgi:hypothetical protein
VKPGEEGLRKYSTNPERVEQEKDSFQITSGLDVQIYFSLNPAFHTGLLTVGPLRGHKKIIPAILHHTIKTLATFNKWIAPSLKGLNS